MSDNNNVKKLIGEAFLEVANAIETGKFGSDVKVGLTTLGSEHGVENLVRGAEMAARSADFDIVLIGPKVETNLEVVEAGSEEEAHKKMEELLDSGYINSCVTMHYSFPIGVSTVGRVSTPSKGKEMFLATTTGTSATNRSEAMFKNAIYGIIAAKTCGISSPTVGILNVDNARAVERGLKELQSNGYDIQFGESGRSDGGCILRGNDALMGSTDVMVTDSLTGNILMKMFSAYTTGGDYESTGFGYGPGVGMDYDRCILILSRASGIPVVAGAVAYAAQLAKGGFSSVSSNEFAKVKAAGFDKIIADFNKDSKKSSSASDGEVKMPDKEVVTGTIAGIDIMDLDDACQFLWKNGIYAESGMGCTGPIVMVNDAKLSAAADILANEGYIAKESSPC